MKAVIYARFSPRRDEEKSESIETQVDLCRQYAARNGIEIVGEPFEDRALSGADEDRPGLWDAIEALRPGWRLMVFRLDRLARNVYLAHVIERAVEARRASILSVSGEGTWSDRAEDRLIRDILNALAAYERRVIATRTRLAMLRHQQNGRRMSSSALTPYGWMADPDDPTRMVRNEDEQTVICEIVRMRRQGESLRGICRRLEAEGIRFRPGTPIVRRSGTYRTTGQWYPKQVARILDRCGEGEKQEAAG